MTETYGYGYDGNGYYNGQGYYDPASFAGYDASLNGGYSPYTGKETYEVPEVYDPYAPAPKDLYCMENESQEPAVLEEPKIEGFDGLLKWEPVRIGLTNTLGIFAPRGSGKSFCIRSLLYENRYRFKAVVVICPTEPLNKSYQGIVPNLFIFDALDQATIDCIDNFYKRQTTIANGMPPWMHTDEDRSLLIIMDDCMATEKKYLNHLKIKDLYKNGRHYKFALWVVVQYFNDLASDLRGNLDVAIVLKVPSMQMRRKFFEYFGGFENKDDFADVLKFYTDNYGALVKDTGRGGSTEVKNQFFWYKADDVPKDFRMNEDQWLCHDFHYIGDDIAKEKMDWVKFALDPTAMVGKPAAPAGKPAKGGKKERVSLFATLVKYDAKGKPVDPH